MEHLLFLDCEFTSLEAPELLSLALVPLEAHEDELYLELDTRSEAFQARHARANAFVRRQVLPQLGLPSFCQGRQASDAQLGAAVASWLTCLAPTGGTLQVAYDYHTDFDLLERVLRDAGQWTRLESVLTPVHVAYLWADPDACLAAQRSLHQAPAHSDRHKLQQHHALADARALREAYLAVHG